MLGYIIRRLLGMIGIFILIAYAIWLFTTPTGYAAFHHLSFSALLPVNYLIWLSHVFHGDLGYSVKEQAPVLSAIQSHSLATVLLVIPAFLLQQVIAIGVGVSAGVRPRSWFDRLAVGIATLLVAIPPFWLALLAVSFAILTQGWPALDITNLRLAGYAFNTTGYWHYFAAHPWEAGVDIARHLTLPVLVLAVLGAAGDSLYVRQRMLEVMRTDYIRAAKARGLSRRTVRWQHGLRNTLLPILTNITTQLPQLVFAAAIVEFVFQLPGVGWLFAHAVFIPPPSNDKPQGINAVIDYQLLTGTLLFFAIITLLSGLFTDILYALADPRIRVGQMKTAFVVNPLRSQQALARLGPVTLRLGSLLSVGAVALALVVGGATLKELNTPVVGEWSGTLVIDGSEQTLTLPTYVRLTITNDGKVQGQLEACMPQAAGPHAIIAIALSGKTDNLTVIALSGNTTAITDNMFAKLTMNGSYAGGKGALNLAGLVYDIGRNGYYATLAMKPNGSLAQFQHACASPT